MANLPELNITDYIEIISRRRWMAIAVFALVVLSFIAYSFLRPPMYEATLTFKVESIYKMLPSEQAFSKDGARMPVQTEEIFDYARRVTSRSVVEESLRKVGILNDSMPLEKQGELIDGMIARAVSSKVVLKSSIIKLSVVYNDPILAATLANTIFETLKSLNSGEKNMRQHNVSAFLATALKNTSKKLKSEEEKLRGFISLGVVGTADTLLLKIDELDKKRVELLSLYTEKYPDVMAISEQISEMKADLKKLPKEEFEYSKVKRDLGIDQKLYNNLKQKLQEAQIKEADTIDNVMLIDKAIPPRAPNYPRKSTFLFIGIIFGIILGAGSVVLFEQFVETSLSRVEDIEALLKVAILGVIPSSTADKATGDKSGAFGGRWFAKNKSAGTIGHLITLQNEGNAFEEAFRILATNVQVVFGKGGRIKNKLVMVASAVPGEGKSLISSNLAIVLSQMGYKTLLIDSDLRLPTIGKLFGLADNSAGFADMLVGTYKMPQIDTDVIKTSTDLMLGKFGAEKIMANPWLNNLHIMTAGSMAPNPMHLFNSSTMKETLTYCQNHYDVVIIDSSPILTVSDPSLLLPIVDGVLLVYKVGSASRISIRRAKAVIDSIRPEQGVTGLILNSVMTKVSIDSHSAYYRGYYGKEKKRNEPGKPPEKTG